MTARPGPRGGKQRVLIGAAASAAVLAVVLLSVWPRGAPSPAPAPPAAAASSPGTRSASSAARGEDGAPGPEDPDELRERIVSLLRSRYGAHIREPYVQVKMLEELLRFFRARDPEHWQQAVLDMIRAAFPDRYAEIAANLYHWLDYERWMNEHQPDLRGLTDAERRKAIWDERKRLFGDEAAQNIWASELKDQAFADALAAVDAQGGGLSEKLAQYKESIEDLHQEGSDAFVQRRQQELLDRFLDLESVQKDLSAEEPEERAKSLREIREGLGLSPEAIQRWEILDGERDTRWEAGASYMQEREALAKQLSGADLETRLEELRARYFGPEAETIATEEQSGFFRFTRPRRWGRN